MIIIKSKSSSHLFKYEGRVEIDIDDEPFLTISADRIAARDIDDLNRMETHVWDKFVLDDIESIRGE